MKLTTLTILSVPFSGIKYFHFLVQPSPQLSPQPSLHLMASFKNVKSSIHLKHITLVYGVVRLWTQLYLFLNGYHVVPMSFIKKSIFILFYEAHFKVEETKTQRGEMKRMPPPQGHIISVTCLSLLPGSNCQRPSLKKLTRIISALRN